MDFEYMLDTVNGADYFRRWHRRKENSGGLLVHKSTHHFDLINWWIEEEPVDVMAYGSRRHFDPDRDRRKQVNRGTYEYVICWTWIDTGSLHIC